ncbi:3-deoxy-manno-octulosonate cytidylyltransferase, partial [Brucella anthropi]
MLQTLKTLTLIPARMASTRLPNKPLADICGKPMIVHVADRAAAAKLGRTVVATDSEEIFAAVQAHGHEVIMTRSDHESGSDRIYEALQKVDPNGEMEAIVNVQGDLPTIDPETIRRALLPLVDGPADIATLGVEITVDEEKINPNVVKIVGSPMNGGERLRALYFTRATAPYGDGPLYHHIGL